MDKERTWMNYPAWLSPLKPQWTGTVRINRFEDAQDQEEDGLTFAEYEKKRDLMKVSEAVLHTRTFHSMEL